MMISSTTSIMLTMAALACTTWAAPILNNSMNATASVGNGSSAGNDLNFEFRYNCSVEEELSKNESNTTYLDFGIGLFVMKDYLKGVRSTLNTTIAMEDEESFVPCNPAPVNNRLLKELETRGPRATEARHLALTYGVLAAYAEYTEGLLEDVSSLPPHVAKKLTTVFEMLQSVIQLFTDVIGPLSCTNNFNFRHYEYNDHPQCTAEFDTLKFAANMVTHLQGAVSSISRIQFNWYMAASIHKYLQVPLAKELGASWISRHTNSC